MSDLANELGRLAELLYGFDPDGAGCVFDRVAEVRAAITPEELQRWDATVRVSEGLPRSLDLTMTLVEIENHERARRICGNPAENHQAADRLMAWWRELLAIEGADVGEYWPASRFRQGFGSTLRMAASSKRKSKPVRTRLIGGVVCYSVEDVGRWWPRELVGDAASAASVAVGALASANMRNASANMRNARG